MALEGKVVYPITEVRLKKAVSSCLSRFGAAYGFKHRAITKILTALHAANPFANFHSSSTMTYKHYIDVND